MNISEKQFFEEFILSDWEVDTFKEIKHYREMNVNEQWILNKYRNEEIDIDLLRIMVFYVDIEPFSYKNGA